MYSSTSATVYQVNESHNNFKFGNFSIVCISRPHHCHLPQLSWTLSRLHLNASPSYIPLPFLLLPDLLLFFRPHVLIFLYPETVSTSQAPDISAVPAFSKSSNTLFLLSPFNFDFTFAVDSISSFKAGFIFFFEITSGSQHVIRVLNVFHNPKFNLRLFSNQPTYLQQRCNISQAMAKNMVDKNWLRSGKHALHYHRYVMPI